MPAKRTGFSSYIRKPKMKTTSRITMPQIPKRPLRFQVRSLLRHADIKGKSPWWLTVHRRGLYRPDVGVNQLEARAVPKGVINGYLTERIIYAALVNLWHFVPGVDFDFQSSIDGGRLELGGLVADFLFPYLRIVINPLGPQHYQFRNMKKDEEQVQVLAERGYQCYLIDEEVTYDEFALEEFLRRIFGGLGSGGGDTGGGSANITTADAGQEFNEADVVYQAVQNYRNDIHTILQV